MKCVNIFCVEIIWFTFCIGASASSGAARISHATQGFLVQVPRHFGQEPGWMVNSWPIPLRVAINRDYVN